MSIFQNNIFQIVLYIALFICITVILYSVFNKLTKKKYSYEKKYIDNSNVIDKYSFLKVLSRKYDKETMNLRFIHANQVLGIKTVNHYLMYKIIITLLFFVTGIRFSIDTNIFLSLLLLIVYTVIGYKIIDIILYFSKKERTKNIKNEISQFLLIFNNFLKAGLSFEDILDSCPKLIKGDLQKEIARFSVNYSLTKDFEDSLKQFMRRLGIPEAEEIEIKLRQCYYTGIYDDLILQEKESIDKKVINDIKKETEMYDIYMGIAFCLMLFNVYLLIIQPLMSLVGKGIFNIAS